MADLAQDGILRAAGEKVRAARDAAGLSQAQVAKRVGLTRSSVANLEAGRQDMNLSRLALIARVLKLDLNELIALVELPPEPPQPHAVEIRRVYEVTCRTCGADLGSDERRSEAERWKRVHIAQTMEDGRG